MSARHPSGVQKPASRREEEPAVIPHSALAIYDVLLEAVVARGRAPTWSKLEIAVIAAMGLSFAVFIATVGFPRTRLIAYLAIAFLLVTSVVYGLVLIVVSLIKLRSPSRIFLMSSRAALQRDVALLDTLAEYPPAPLRVVHRRVDNDIQHMRARFAVLIGVTEKLGIVPASVTLYFAYANYRKTGGEAAMADYALGLLVAMYFGALIAQSVLERMSDLRELVREALVRSEARDAARAGAVDPQGPPAPESAPNS